MNTNIKDVRSESLISGEKRYLAMETMRGVMDWFHMTKPTTFVGKEISNEQEVRQLWAKWLEAVERVVFEKGNKLPELLMDDVIGLFRGNENAEFTRAPKVREEDPRKK